MSATRSDPRTCAALGRALSDGRFAEDPRHWRPHVEGCAACRASVEGYVELRERIDRARKEAPGEPCAQSDPRAVVAHAMARHRLLRARRITTLSASALLVATLGIAALWSGAPPRPAEEEPLTLAMALHRTVFPADGSPARLNLLRDDAQQRARFVAALDHRSAVVRRIALSALTFSGIEPDPSRLEEVLGTWNEDLESPLTLASAPGADRGRLVAEALAQGRAQTLQATLYAAKIRAAQGGKPVAAALVLPHLEAGDVGVRLEALGALAEDPGYVPGGELERLLGSGHQPVEVRQEAARCLAKRLGDEGVRRVVALLGRMDDAALIEPDISSIVLSRPAGVEWGRSRVIDEGVPIRTALAYAAGLLPLGETVPQESLVRRALAEPDAETTGWLIDCCRLGNWTAQRAALQVHWKAHSKVWRRSPQGDQSAGMLPSLLAWDEAAGTAERLNQGLDICAELGQHRSSWVTRWLGRAAAHRDPAVASRAKALLADKPGD